MPAGRLGSCGWGGSRTRPVFFAEIGRVPHRDRFSSVPRSVWRGHARLPGSRDGHLCTRPAFPRESNGPVVGLTQKCRVRCAEAVRQWGCSSADAGPGSSVNARHVSLRCFSADAGPGPLLAPAPSSDSNRNAHVGGTTSGRSWRRRRTRSECPRRPDHQCGRDDPAPDRLIARGEGCILMLDRTRPPEHVLTHREHPRPPTACASSTPSGRGLTGRNRSRAGTEPISTRNTTDLGEGTGRGGEGAGTRGDARGAPRSAAGGLAVRPPAPRRSRRNSRAPLPWEGD